MMSTDRLRRAWRLFAALALLFASVGSPTVVLAGDREHDTNDSDARNQDIERKLEAARGRLENDAREVADLSQQLGGTAMHDVLIGEMFGGRRAILGINLGSNGDVKVDGVYVAGVSPGGPADQAGVKSGDVIVALDGKKLAASGASSANVELMQRLRDVKPGDKVKLQYLRDGKLVNTDVTTRAPEHPRFGAHGGHWAMPAMPPMAPMPPLPPNAPTPPFAPGQLPFFDPFMDAGFGDMEVVTLTPKLGSYFGTDHGALVVRAASADLKLEEGDVITAIDGRPPQSGAHALRILHSYQPGEKIRIAIMRGRKAQTLEATLPERPHGSQRRFFVAPAAPAMPAAPAAPAELPAPPRPPADGANDRT